MRNVSVYYRVSFYNQGAVYVVYAKYVAESQLFGFLELSELVFDQENAATWHIDKKIKEEFTNVKISYIPTHAVIRIDEIEDQKVKGKNDRGVDDGNVSQFPLNHQEKNNNSESGGSQNKDK